MIVFGYIQKYWKSLLVVFVILYLSLMKQPSNEKLVLFEGVDKVVHFLMYFGLSSILWLDHLMKYKGGYKWTHLLVGAVFLPILFGGLMEVFQDIFTSDRACELKDLLCNTLGVLTASAFFMVYLKLKKRK